MRGTSWSGRGATPTLRRQGRRARTRPSRPALAALEEAAEADAGDTAETADADASAAAGHATFAWRGTTHGVPSDRARAALVAAHAADARAAAAAAAGDAAGRLAALDAAVAAYGDAKAAARAAAAAAPPSSDARAAADARALVLAVTGAALERSLERGTAAAAALAARLDGPAGGTAAAAPATTTTTKKKAKPPRADDAVRAYTAHAKTSKALADVAASLGGAAGEMLLDDANAAAAAARAHRCFWAARALLATGKCGDAAALFDRTADRAAAAVDAAADCARPDTAPLADLDALTDKAAAWRCVAAAQAASRAGRALRDARGGVAALDLRKRPSGDGDDGGAPTTYLADALDSWESFASGGPVGAPRVAPMPPRPELVPVRPLVLDLAFDAGVPCPDVSHRAAKDAVGGGSVSAAASAAASAASAATAAASRLFGGWGRG